MLAIVPPEPLRTKIDEVRHEFARTYQCVEAIRRPVHLTLFPPFRFPEAKEDLLASALTPELQSLPSFRLRLNNFSSFANNGVIFIDVERSEELGILHERVSTIMHENFFKNKSPKSRFHPHFTIGYRDIPKDRFAEAVSVYASRSFTGSFSVDKVALWKHRHGNWQAIEWLLLKPLHTAG